MQKPLLILDLNGILIYRLSYKGRIPGAVKLGNFSVWKRPFTEEFFDMIFKKYTIGVWSSANKKNMDLLLNFVFGDRRKDIYFEMNQTSCVTIPNPDEPERPFFIKDLKNVWDLFGIWSMQNTLILDDSLSKVKCNPVGTFYCPDSWTYLDTEDNELSTNGEIYKFLNERL